MGLIVGLVSCDWNKMAVVTTYEEETFTLALRVFSLVRVMREYFMVGAVYPVVAEKGLDPHSSLSGHAHGDLSLAPRPCLLKVLPAPNSESLGQCLNPWAFE